MQRKPINFFVCSAGALLTVTAIAKLVSSAGDARILQNPDPILSISFRHVFWIVGGIELVIATVCFFGKWIEIKAGLIAWLATSFLVYRIGLVWVGYHKPCSCLGNLTDALHIPPQMADTAMKIILAYLLIGSYAILFWLWRLHRKGEERMQNDEIEPEARVGG
jgi:cbb3-type cytochrome oxidase subunit 3